MIIKIKPQANPKSVERLLEFIQKNNLTTKDVSSDDVYIFGVIGDTTRLTERDVYAFDCVAQVIRITVPFKKASRAFKITDTQIDLGDGVVIGGTDHLMMVGPCSVESEAQIDTIAAFIKTQGLSILRGGAYKPRTSPYSFQGHEEEGLKWMRQAADTHGLKVISEIPSVNELALFEQYVDIIQVGARNMQNFHLLKALGQSSKPIFLKRGLSATIEEWLMSAEYILNGGNEHVILCERGIRTFETYTRNTLDLSAVLAIKELSHLPVFADPSHASGRYKMIDPLAKASLAVGAHGQMIEIHPEPEKALSDGAQSLTFERFAALMEHLKPLARTLGVTLK